MLDCALIERVDGGGGADTEIRGAGVGDRGAGDGDKGGGGREEGVGTGEEGAGLGKFWGQGLYQNLLYLPIIFMYFSAITGYQKYLIDVLK